MSSATVYRYLANGTIRCLQLKRTTLIRMKDVDALFDNAPSYKKRSRIIREESSYYSMREITEKYHISAKAARSRCEQLDIPTVYKGRNAFYSKAAIDVKFAELIEEFSRENYYTVKELMAKFSMTHSAVLSFVARHKIPRLSRLNNVYYSKVHIDNIKVKQEGFDSDYYTYAEIGENFNLTKDQISYYLRNYTIRTEKRGKFTMIHRRDFDQAVKERTGIGKEMTVATAKAQKEQTVAETDLVIREGYYTCAAIAKRYKLGTSCVQGLMLEHSMPRIYLDNTYYYEQSAVDNLFAEREGYANVKEWISKEQMSQFYGTSLDGCRLFLRRNNIPFKIESGTTLYSKDHIEFAKGLKFEGRENYYSSTEVMEKFGIAKDLLCYYAKQKNFQKTRCAQYVYYLKEDVDAAMAERNDDIMALEKKREEERLHKADAAQSVPAPEGYYSTTETCEKYHITLEALKHVVKKNGIEALRVKRYVFYPQAVIDSLLADRLEEVDRNEWLTSEEVDHIFDFKTPAARTAYIHLHEIPTKCVANVHYYSKSALDAAKNHVFDGREKYYSKEEAMEKFNLSGDNLFSFAKRHNVATVKHGRAVFYLKEDLDKAIAGRNARITKAIPSGYYSIEQLSSKYGIPHKQVENGASAQKIPFIVASGITYYDKRASDAFFSHEERQYEVIEWLTGEEVDKRYGFTTPQSRNVFIKTHQIPFVLQDDNRLFSKQHLDEARNQDFEGRESYYTIKEIAEKYNVSHATVLNQAKRYRVQPKCHGKLCFYLKTEIDKIMTECSGNKK